MFDTRNAPREKEPVVEDGHRDFFDAGKKPTKKPQAQSNRFAGMDGQSSEEEK